MSRHSRIFASVPAAAFAALVTMTPAAPGASADAAPGTRAFPYLKQLQPDAPPARQIGCFPIDEEIYNAATPDFANLRIVDSRGTEIPYLVRPRRENRSEMTERPVDLKTVSFNTLPDNRIEVVVARSRAGSAPCILEVSTQARDFEKNVSVFVSADSSSWTLLAANRPIFDYTRFIDIRNNRVEFPASDSAYYKLVFAGITETSQSPLRHVARETRDGKLISQVENLTLEDRSFRIDRITFRERVAVEYRDRPATNRCTASGLDVRTDPRAKTTIATFSTRRAPVTRIELQIANPNFSRMALVEGFSEGPEGSEWRTITPTTLRRVRADRFEQEATAIALSPPRQFGKYRITIRNQDNPPLEITGVTLWAEAREAVFFSTPGQAYTVFYGGDGTDAPHYDIGAVLASAETAAMDRFTAGSPQANPAHKPPAGWKRINTKTFLVAAVILVVATLGWLIAGSLRRLDPPGGGGASA